MRFSLSVFAVAGLVAFANAHGYFVSPPARQPGPKFSAACGQQAYDMMAADINGNIQALESVSANQADYDPKKCHYWQCKGMKYGDNLKQIQKYKAGEKVPMNFQIRAPHTGYANVSIVSTWGYGNKVLAANLKKWDVYASNSVPIVASQENFSIKMPTTLGSKCAKAGACVIQMFWNAESINQTYESCIDFTMAASSSKRELGGRAHARDFEAWEAEEE